MQRKNLLIFIGLVTGIWIGSTPVQGQIEPTIPAQDAQSQTTQTSPPDRDWSQVVIDAQDLPPGFQGMPAEDLAELKQELSADDFSVESVFAFMEPNNFELLLGLTTPCKISKRKINLNKFWLNRKCCVN
jgi:hypothetical protein